MKLFANIRKFIKHHLMISRMLGITPFRPVFIVSDRHEFKSGDFSGLCKKIRGINFCIIFLRKDTIDNMIITHAHELWHVYQTKYTPKIFDQEPEKKIAWQYEQYAYQNKPCELEANAFAFFYAKALGLDLETTLNALSVDEFISQIFGDNYIDKIIKTSEKMEQKYIKFIQEREV